MQILLALMTLVPIRCLLVGPVRPGLELVRVSPFTGLKYFRNKQIQSIAKNFPEDIVHELGLAKTWCREHIRDHNAHVSMLRQQPENCIIYSILYRERSQGLPRIVTIEGLIFNPDSESQVSVQELYEILESFCKDNSLFLQTQELKSWSNGKIRDELHLEKCEKL